MTLKKSKVHPIFFLVLWIPAQIWILSIKTSLLALLWKVTLSLITLKRRCKKDKIPIKSNSNKDLKPPKPHAEMKVPKKSNSKDHKQERLDQIINCLLQMKFSHLMLIISWEVLAKIRNKTSIKPIWKTHPFKIMSKKIKMNFKEI